MPQIVSVRIPYRFSILLFFLLGWGMQSCTPPASTPSQQPNFIVIYTDDQQFDGIGLHNPHIQTPNLDRVLSQGMEFTQAHVAFSLCSPSRAAVLSGRYGSSNGVLDFTSRNRLNDGEVLIPTYLKAAGYRSGLSGKWHIQQAPKSLGFDFASYFKGNGTYYGRKVFEDQDTLYPEIHIDAYGVDRAIDFITDCQEAKQPFFLFHCPQTPHMNGDLIWDAQDSTKARYQVSEMPIPANNLDPLTNKAPYLQQVRNRVQAQKYGYPDSLAIQAHTRDYYSVITELDGFLGKLFHYLEQEKLMQNTYLLFMSDNGWMVGDHGFTSKVLPYRTSTRVPFWILGPGIVPRAHQSLVSNLDILPTILDLAQVPLPDSIHGRSLRPLLYGEKASLREHFVYEGLGSYGGSKPNLSIITEQFRYIESYEDTSMTQIHYQELYDLAADPWEMKNLAQAAAYQAQVARMQQQIKDFQTSILPNKNQ